MFCPTNSPKRFHFQVTIIWHKKQDCRLFLKHLSCQSKHSLVTLLNDFSSLFCCSGSFPGANHHPAREPRVAADHAGLRLLWRMPEEVRQRQRLEVLHRPVRLPSAHRTGWWTGRTSAGGAALIFTQIRFNSIFFLLQFCSSSSEVPYMFSDSVPV